MAKQRKHRLTKAQLAHMEWVDAVTSDNGNACHHISNERGKWGKRDTATVLLREGYYKRVRPNRYGMRKLLLTNKGKKAVAQYRQSLA